MPVQVQSLFSQVLVILGALGLFLFGMKTMSEALQRIAGGRLRSALASMIQTPARQVLVGMALTAIVQSSSATTVMIVSFVNAGLLNLMQSIGMIMGANIGTTVTAWIIALFGFQVDVGMAAIPLIAVGCPLLFSRRDKVKSSGNIIIGFALLFLAITILKTVMGGFTGDPRFVDWLGALGHHGFWSLLMFMGVGLMLTVVIQSSSAMIALTIIMCSNGWIPFDCGLAMILGENIGTTSTANIAASVTNTNARRAALAHAVFNVVGVVWALPLVPVAAEGIAALFVALGGASPVADPTAAPVAMALFHTLFNVLNTLLLVGFIPQIASLVAGIVRGRAASSAALRHIGPTLLSTDGISLIQAQSELRAFARRATRMFGMVRNLFRETNADRFGELMAALGEAQRENARFRQEYSAYLARALQEDVGAEAKQDIQIMSRLAADIEIMSDSTFSVAKLIRTKKEKRIWFAQQMRDDLNRMFDLVDEALAVMNANVGDLRGRAAGLAGALGIEERINALRTELKEYYLHLCGDEEANYQATIMFADLVTHVELLADAIVHISEDAQEITSHE